MDRSSTIRGFKEVFDIDMEEIAVRFYNIFTLPEEEIMSKTYNYKQKSNSGEKKEYEQKIY